MRNSSRSHGAGAAEPRRRAKGRKMADVGERWSIPLLQAQPPGLSGEFLNNGNCYL